MKNRETSDSLLEVKQIPAEILDFLKSSWDVFRVFDGQDSGCVSYGVPASEGKYFVKYSERDSAVGHLKESIHFYKNVSHSCILKLLSYLDTSSVFERTDFCAVWKRVVLENA